MTDTIPSNGNTFLTVRLEGGWINSRRKKSLADIKYPHKCFKCGRDLFWTELLAANIGFLSYKLFNRAHLIKLWKSKYVQFYCCNCYIDQQLGFNKSITY